MSLVPLPQKTEESIDSYGVFLSNDRVRVRKVLSSAAKAEMTEAEREAYDNDFKIAYYPGEYSSRIVQAPDQDMAIYTAGLLDGADQAEEQMRPGATADDDEDLCASGHTV
jgi:hypothetical protein